MNLRKAAVVVALAVFGSFGVQAVWADDIVANLFEPAPDDYIKTRSYFGMIGTSSNIDDSGDFNNSLIFSHDYNGNMETNLVPSISRNFGFGAMVGYRTGSWAAEVSYWCSDHDSLWSDRLFAPGSPTTYFGVASYQSFNVDFKRYFFTKYPAQPFINLGISFPWLVAEDGSLLDVGGIPVIDDATISGFGFTIGTGLEVYLGQDFSVIGGINQRFSGFNQINGAAKQSANVLTFTGALENQANLVGNGINFFIAGTVGFE